MSSEVSVDVQEWQNLFELDAIADPSDKLAECQYFLELAVQESDKNKFRWLISAFFGAAYSFFEINALRAYQCFQNPETGNPIANDEALEVLRCYVTVKQDPRRPTYVKTSGQHEVTKALYALRRGNTHHFPLSLVTNGPQLPEDFCLGIPSANGRRALDFCRQVMLLIQRVESDLQQHF